MNELRRKVRALLAASLEGDVLVDAIIAIVLAAKPRRTLLTHVESDVVPKQNRTSNSTHLSLDLNSVSDQIPDLSKPLISKSESDEAEGSGLPPPGFLEFWGLYPKHVGKADALRAWRRRRPPITRVRATLAWQVKSKQWLEGFIPNPATYINQGRWEDEPQRTLNPLPPRHIGLCDFHLSARNANMPAQWHDEGCSECKHVKALRNPRPSGDPVAIGGGK